MLLPSLPNPQLPAKIQSTCAAYNPPGKPPCDDVAPGPRMSSHLTINVPRFGIISFGIIVAFKLDFLRTAFSSTSIKKTLL